MNALDLAPSDRILLARGATFNVSTGPSLILTNEDDGSSIAWNSVEPYGSGADPVITGGDVAETIGIFGTDIDYWKFNDIEFRNASSGATIFYETLNHSGLHFDRSYFHDMIDDGAFQGNGINIVSIPTNLAKAATPSAQSTDTGNGYCACRLNDGETDDFTGWSAGAGTPQWVQLDWGSSQTIDGINVTTTNGYITQEFQVQYWNGSSWQSPAIKFYRNSAEQWIASSTGTVSSNTQKSIPIRFDSPVSTTKIRLNITVGDQNGTARIEELAVFNWASVVTSGSDRIVNDVSITDSEFGPIGFFVSIDANNSRDTDAIQDVLFMRNYVHDVTWTGAYRYVTGLDWLGNRVENVGTGYLGSGATILHLWAVHDAVFANSILDTVPDTSSFDQTTADLAFNIDDVRFQNNLIEDAAGPGMEFASYRANGTENFDATANSLTDQEVSGNVFRNNGSGAHTTPRSLNFYTGGISLPSECLVNPTISVANNLYFEPTGFFNFNGCAASVTFAGNKPVERSDDLYYGGQAFSDSTCSTSPWSYESSTNGSTWSTMSTHATVHAHTDERCKPAASSVPWVNRFEAFPDTGSSYSVARTWTAPRAGVISVRGRALKAELGGDGVTVRVTKNGTAIVSAASLGANDRDGVATNADGVTVAAGDKIRFEIDDGSTNTNDRVSWAPAVGYTIVGHTASAEFGTTQGENGWKYQYAAAGSNTYTNITNYDATNAWWEKSSSQPPWVVIAASWQHPESDDSVRTWVAPSRGIVTITSNAGNVRLNSTPNDGTHASIRLNTSATEIWGADILDTTGVSMGTVGPIVVNPGDEIHFRLNQRSNQYGDATLWDPNVLFAPAEASLASERIYEVQGAGQWSYEYALPGSYIYTNLGFWDATNLWWEKSSSQPPWVVVAASWQHPDTDDPAGADSVRTWTAPVDGTVVITSNAGNVRLNSTPNDGTRASILKNASSTPIWAADILDTTGVSMGTVGPISVAAGDQIHFRVNQHSNRNGDATLWDPKIWLAPDYD